MLVLSRKMDQTVMIGDEIEVFVVRIRGDKVCLGFRAPPNVTILRREIYDDKQWEGDDAGEASSC